MGLLGLPPELLSVVIDETLPCDLEAFALTCKTVYHNAASQIRRHNALKRKWGQLDNVHPGGMIDTLSLLFEISCDPNIAYYVEHLSFRSLSEPYDPLTSLLVFPRTSEDRGFRENEDGMLRVKELVLASEHLRRANVDAEGWWAKMLVDDDSEIAGESEVDDALHIMISVIGLLPNLKTLKMFTGWDIVPSSEGSATCKDMISVTKSILQCAQDSLDRVIPLGKLETILPFTKRAGYDVRAPLQCLEPFMTLTSLREIFAVSCISVDDGYTGIPFHWSSQLNSQLRRLELAHCCIDADGLAALTSHTPLLEVFKYSHETKWHGCQHDWNPGTFLEAGLATHCGTSITELALTVDLLYGDIENGVSSLHSFPKLGTLEVDVQVFCGPPLSSGQQLGMDAKVPDGDTPWKTEDIPCIGSMLPESIYKVYINTHGDMRPLESLVKDIRYQRESRLQGLEKVIVRELPGDDSALELVKRQGIELEILDDPDYTMDSTMMPLWKREFDRLVGGVVNT
ncbi:hypothetical protein BCR34DRAFT_499310 [Clohesyomyces aquaticus]|uniref:F-box domain-containing protein n=1 Tax=Clohesyomyces aquaticus TaxID=1231657 RepID=A0A1Y1Y8L3_9PLEO|nr:hypothetical protein BCR34DRAFT_499310 [Clohesyomyces aquaticus]